MNTNLVIDKIMEMNGAGIDVIFRAYKNPGVISVTCVKIDSTRQRKQANVDILSEEMKRQIQGFDAAMVHVLDEIIEKLK